jgi:hypothetical protein
MLQTQKKISTTTTATTTNTINLTWNRLLGSWTSGVTYTLPPPKIAGSILFGAKPEKKELRLIYDLEDVMIHIVFKQEFHQSMILF